MFRVKLDSQEDVVKLASVSQRKGYTIDAIHGRYRLDAKSVLGLFSLDLSQEISIVPSCDEDEEGAFAGELEDNGVKVIKETL